MSSLKEQISNVKSLF